MLDQLGSRKFGVIIFDAQKDYSDLDGKAPKYGCSALYASIANLLKKNSHRIQFIYTTYTVEDPFDVKFRESWRFLDTGIHPAQGDVVRRDTLSSTGYSVHFRPVVHATGKVFDGEKVLQNRSHQPHSKGCALDEVVATQCKAFRVEHLRSDVQSIHCPLNISNWLVVGNMYNPRLVTNIMAMLDGTKWLLKDLCRGLLSSKNGHWVNSFDLLHEAPMTRGLPYSMQPCTMNTMQPLSEVFTTESEDVLKNVKLEWKRLLASIQMGVTLLHFPHKDKVYKRVNADGKEIVHCTGGCENIVEFVDERTLNSTKPKDSPSRNTYNATLRSTRRSMVDLCFGVPPIQNPYGPGLMNGRGSLPFFGPNHLIVKMYVVNAPNAERTTYFFEYDEELSPHVPEMTISNPIVVYQGYLPHHENTRHAWKECVVVAIDSQNPPSTLQKRVPSLMEFQWIETLKRLDHKPTLRVPLLSLEDISLICSPEVAHFMRYGLHLQSAKAFVNWVKHAPRDAGSLLRTWKREGLFSLQNILQKEKLDDSDYAYIYRAFRVQQDESNWSEFLGGAKNLYGEKFNATGWDDVKGLSESFEKISIDNELLKGGLTQLADVVSNARGDVSGADLPLVLWKDMVYIDESDAKAVLSKMTLADAVAAVEFVCMRNLDAWLRVTKKLSGHLDDSTAVAHSTWISEQLESPGCGALYEEKIYHSII